MSKQVKKSRQSAKPYKLVMPTKETQKVAQKLYGHIAEVHLSERLPEALPNDYVMGVDYGFDAQPDPPERRR